MSQFTITLQDEERCHIKHELADAEIITDLPPEYGGQGRSFSSTDLVSAALGSCLFSSIATICQREGLNTQLMKMMVRKTLQENPKMIKAIDLVLSYPEMIESSVQKKMQRAMAVCPVKRSLNSQIAISIVIIHDKD